MAKNTRTGAEHESQPKELVTLESGVRVNRKHLERRRRSRRLESSAAGLVERVSGIGPRGDFDDEPTKETPRMSVSVPAELPGESRRTVEMAAPPVTEPSLVDRVIELPKPDVYRSRHIELCDCGAMNDSFRIRALFVLPGGAIVLPPLVMSNHIDELTDAPVNPIGFCIGCGERMDRMVVVEPPIMDPGLPTACCRGMQKALLAERTVLPVEKYLNRYSSILQATLTSADCERLKHDHCGWCGTWLQKFLLEVRTRRLDNGWNVAATAA